ncbi:MAG TPA: aldo/keto reductase, partial [Armatimonadota bacterium]
ARTGEAPRPAMSVADTLGNLRTTDRWRMAIGLTYDSETLEAESLPASGRPLQRRSDAPMKYGAVKGIDLPVARLVMGTMLEGATLRVPHSRALFDDYFERGGNCFDTAYVYGSEVVFGNWVRQRGVRDQVVVIAKGAHTPFCTPEGLTRQLHESLDNLGMTGVDLYMLHRDNLEVPVGEFVDVLNEHLKAGRMKAFGGSNWTLERVEEANRYAEAHGLVGFSAVSNNLSLARMVDEVWAGCVASSDPASLEWLNQHQMPVFSWSSQARGFFSRANPDDHSDSELVRCWYSEDNFRRLERARELARKKGTLPTNIAAAYVLCQPFPTFALIGPRSLEETRTAMPALDVELTPEEMAWLDLRG